jgi:hypothetical protein
VSQERSSVRGNHSYARNDFVAADKLQRLVIELEVSLLSLDSSAHASRRKQQFEMGGES